jgi:hypothetical protein
MADELNEKTRKGRLTRNVGFVNGMPIVYYGDRIARPNSRVGSGMATRAIPPGTGWRGHNAGYSQQVRPKGRKSGKMSNRKGIKESENMDLIKDIKALFAEAEDTDALYQSFEDQGISKEVIDHILGLEESEELDTETSTDETPKEEILNELGTDSPSPYAKEIMAAVIDQRPADVKDILDRAMKEHLGKYVDQIKYDMFGNRVDSYPLDEPESEEETETESEPETEA